jgi:hypothetical protein
MSDTDPARPITDPTVPQQGNAHGTNDGYSGQEAGSFESPDPLRVDASAARGGTAAAPAPTHDDGESIPDEAGTRAWIDQTSGEVHGSGAGAGGGAAGEDYDSHSPGGTGQLPPAGGAADPD